jgi:hypothetical protein
LLLGGVGGQSLVPLGTLCRSISSSVNLQGGTCPKYSGTWAVSPIVLLPGLEVDRPLAMHEYCAAAAAGWMLQLCECRVHVRSATKLLSVTFPCAVITNAFSSPLTVHFSRYKPVQSMMRGLCKGVRRHT